MPRASIAETIGAGQDHASPADPVVRGLVAWVVVDEDPVAHADAAAASMAQSIFMSDLRIEVFGAEERF